jgi:hypothetical protein
LALIAALGVAIVAVATMDSPLERSMKKAEEATKNA